MLARTPFNLASITKPLTATAVMTLVAKGKLDLNSPANRYLSDTPIIGSVYDAGRVSVRQLGAHVSGLPSMFTMYGQDEISKPPKLPELMREWGRLAYSPLATYEYSNLGYAALGGVAERIAGRPFADLIRTNLLEPLELTDSFYQGAPQDLARAARHYDELGRRIPFYLTGTPPSGELFASARDLIRFANFHLKQVTGRGMRVLPGALIDNMHRPLLSGPRGGTSFGWFTGRSRTGLSVIFKDGGQPGVSTVMYLVPTAGAACVVLTNRTDVDGWVQDAADRIMATQIPDWSAPDTSMRLSPGPIKDPLLQGCWSGELVGDGSSVSLGLDFTRSTLLVAGVPPNPLANLQLEGDFVTARSGAQLNSAEAQRNVTSDLKLKLAQLDRALVGRALAIAERPGWLGILPLGLQLHHSQ